jgi:Pyridine nucleotide-disulphide oxidoreductase
MVQPAAPRIAVLGAGPVGLEAALYALALNLPVTIYERGRVAEHLQRWGHIKLFSPFGMNSTSLGRAAIRAENAKQELPADGDCLTGRDHASTYLEPLAMTGQLIECLKLDTRVVQIGRSGLLKGDVSPKRGDRPFHLLLRDNKGEESTAEADVVLDCTGTYGQPRWLGDGGIPAIGETAARPQVAGGLEDILGKDRAKYAAKTVLVVGAGYTAATHVCRLGELSAAHPEQWTIWLARGPRSTPMHRHPNDPLRERDRLAAKANMLACRGEGNVEFHASSNVESIISHGPDKGFTVSADVSGKSMTWNVDRVIASVGYSPDTTIYRELQIQECPVTLGPHGVATALAKHSGEGAMPAALGPAALKTPEPNFYVLGAKSFGRNSQFLLRTGFEQVREVFTLIAGKPDLNLYVTH